MNKVLKKSIPRDLNPQMLVPNTSVFTFSPKIEVTLFDCFRIFIIKLMAPSEGFEPSRRSSRPCGFQDRPLQPLE